MLLFQNVSRSLCYTLFLHWVFLISLFYLTKKLCFSELPTFHKFIICWPKKFTSMFCIPQNCPIYLFFCRLFLKIHRFFSAFLNPFFYKYFIFTVFCELFSSLFCVIFLSNIFDKIFFQNLLKFFSLLAAQFIIQSRVA